MERKKDSRSSSYRASRMTSTSPRGRTWNVARRETRPVERIDGHGDYRTSFSRGLRLDPLPSAKSEQGQQHQDGSPAEGSRCAGSGTSTIVVAIRFRSSFFATRFRSSFLATRFRSSFLATGFRSSFLATRFRSSFLATGFFSTRSGNITGAGCISVRIRDSRCMRAMGKKHRVGKSTFGFKGNPLCHVQMIPKAIPARPVASSHSPAAAPL